MNTIYEPIKSSLYPDFYIIPGIENYQINVDSDIVDIRNNIILNPWYSGSYLECGLKDNDEWKKFSVHRLVCLAFHGPAPSEKHQINHKDGVKDNNDPDNLEWVTPGQNQQHAYDFGLKHGPRTNKPIIVWDTKGDPERLRPITYHSTYQAVKLNQGFKRAPIEERLNLRLINSLYKGRYYFRFSDDKTKWPTLEELYINYHNRYIMAFNVYTKKWQHAQTIGMLSTAINVGVPAISKAIQKKRMYLESGWLLSVEQFPDWAPLIKVFFKRYPIVICFNIKTKETTYHKHASALSNYYIFPKHSITESLNEKRYRYKHYIVFYKNDNSPKLHYFLNQFGYIEAEAPNL